MFLISKKFLAVGAVIAAVVLAGVIGVTAAIASGPVGPVRQVSADTGVALPLPTVTVTAEPLPAVTAEPLPAVTETVTATATARPVPAVTVTRTVTGAAAPAPARSTAPNGRTFGDGTWKVGSEIAAGTYVTDVLDGGYCSYRRLSGFSGDSGDIIAINAYSGPARGRFTVAPSDLGVTFTGDCTWTKE